MFLSAFSISNHAYNYESVYMLSYSILSMYTVHCTVYIHILRIVGLRYTLETNSLNRSLLIQKNTDLFPKDAKKVCPQVMIHHYLQVVYHWTLRLTIADMLLLIYLTKVVSARIFSEDVQSNDLKLHTLYITLTVS